MMLLGAMAFSSCDMDLKPVGTLDEETAIQNSLDMRKFRNTLYSNLRTVTAGSYVYLTDIQLDAFNGLISNGNNLSDFSFGQIYPTNSSITSYWGGNYVMISNCNALIDHADRLMASSGFTDNDKIMFARYKGEALFTRAFGYFGLVEHFSKSYTQTDPNAKASGVPLVTKYSPTGDVTKYPGRALSLRHTLSSTLTSRLLTTQSRLTRSRAFLTSIQRSTRLTRPTTSHLTL